MTYQNIFKPTDIVHINHWFRKHQYTVIYSHVVLQLHLVIFKTDVKY